ncbi:MAG: rod shape-determining protein MreC [Planctomycetota bacterium]|jgi:rod shape-determining protein MreC
MRLKRKKKPDLILLMLFGLTGLIILCLPQSMTSKLQFAFVRFFRAPLNFCNKITYPKPKNENTTNILNPYRYVRLRNHLANNIQLLHEQRQQLTHLNEVSNRYAWNGANFVLADIITFSIDYQRADVIINRGKNDGLASEQYVLGDYCVIGTIARLDDRTAYVRLVTDPASKLPVTIGQSDISALLEGIGNNQARIKLLPTEYNIKAGDIIYARKTPGFLDASIIVGSITECFRSQANPLVWDIKAIPACDVKTLENVTVVVMKEPQQMENTQTAQAVQITEKQNIK